MYRNIDHTEHTVKHVLISHGMPWLLSPWSNKQKRNWVQNVKIVIFFPSCNGLCELFSILHCDKCHNKWTQSLVTVQGHILRSSLGKYYQPTGSGILDIHPNPYWTSVGFSTESLLPLSQMMTSWKKHTLHSILKVKWMHAITYVFASTSGICAACCHRDRPWPCGMKVVLHEPEESIFK